MTRLKLAAHADDIIRDYESGVSAIKIAKAYNTTTTTVTSLLKKLGRMEARPRGWTSAENIAKANKAVQLFNNGVRPSEIIKQIGIPKNTLYKRLHQAGCDLRGLDGWELPDESREAIAISKQINGVMNESEQLIYDRLVTSGYDVIPQLAVGKYNVDLSIRECSVAIEICCRGTFRGYVNESRLAKRVKKLGESGWHTYVLVAEDFADISRIGIDDMLAWLDFTKRSPTILREYRVVRGSHDLLAAGKSNCKNLPSIIDSI